MNTELNKPDFLFEVSWEVCNKVGGIYTVISTKAQTLTQNIDSKIIYIGPDIPKHSAENLDFIEDRNLYSTWVNYAQQQGFRVRMGHWQIEGSPLAILIDYTPMIAKKDSIFSELWETYRLDSLTGGWDYIEPVLFGYITGAVIDSFCRFNLSPRLKIIAQFHEWMTGAGILFLKKNTRFVSTVFTTHSTVVGRSIASNGQNLYDHIEKFSGEAKAHEFNIVAKNSLEKIAANNADVFTTVSNITALECYYFLKRKVDTITPNGFANNFVPSQQEAEQKREKARQKIFEVAGALNNTKYDSNTLIVATSGRYEYRNKGIDIFIDAIAQLKSQNLNRKILALVLVPGNHDGARQDLKQKIKQKNFDVLDNCYITHNLHYIQHDQVVRRINETGLNTPGDVSIIFIPAYLDQNDGIINIGYYDLLNGIDLTTFVSYYEPWGYTPLESLAFSIPTITTSLTGFGQWIKQNTTDIASGAVVIERTDGNTAEVTKQTVEIIADFCNQTPENIIKIREKAKELSKQALWSDLIRHYLNVYDIAIQTTIDRNEPYEQTTILPGIFEGNKLLSNNPTWKKMRILTNIPQAIEGLVELSKNVWWSWNYEAVQLFKYVDEDTWIRCNKNPIILLNNISQERLLTLEQDKIFLDMYHSVMDNFHRYMSKELKDTPSVAYFSMEYGLNNTINIYSGGLGILAGDYLKEASDSCLNLVGVGLMYRQGYFTQQLTLNGEQIAIHEDTNLNNIPVKEVRDKDGSMLIIDIYMPGRTVKLRAWELAVGRIKLYLLDSDIIGNSTEDRKITHQLYGGDWENRLKQEVILGFGSIRLLKALGIECEVYHCNEGHAAFTNLERISNFIEDEQLSFDEAKEIVRHSSLFTTHTPVPAGHDAFSEELMRMYLKQTADKLNITWEQFMDLGRWVPGKYDEKFSMSVLAVNLCQEVNGVSYLHGKVTKEIFKNLYKGYFPEELNIGYVTNGVHYATWTAKEFRKLYETYFGENFITDNSNQDKWKNIYNVPNEEIWGIRQILRQKLINYIKNRYRENWIKRNDNPHLLQTVLHSINENTLTIGFARRFATYKRASLLFADLNRLSKLVNNPERPVQFIYAGKAHPKDKPGQDLIKRIFEISQMPEFVGKITFVENYDIQLAKRLVKGVDVWLNTPTRPLEASGTSGEKATLNGVLNCSVLDGWYYEGYVEGAGWALTDKRTYENQDFQDELDALELYRLLEDEIIPMFYKRNKANIPTEWVKTIKNSIALIAPKYVTSRMMHDYAEQYYIPLAQRNSEIRENNYAKASRISNWKRHITDCWNQIEVVSVDFPDTTKKEFLLGTPYNGEVILDINNIDPESVGVEVVFIKPDKEDNQTINSLVELKIQKCIESIVFYSEKIHLNQPGNYEYALRIYPKNKELAHRTDINLLHWI